ncbi:unnamed protein product [Dibothriocephalus latus]|uniref:Uncharacterized protein n=1 Tax=Dibothriocephalus latus TaxID=60516 RepID=A0A3P7P698_DIBLA|nr:unnamed protein product [Dibothriocephalus latus]
MGQHNRILGAVNQCELAAAANNRVQCANPEQVVVTHCELFFYACRVVERLPRTQLVTPLENFPHFAALDPLFLMSEELTKSYTPSLQQAGFVLRRLSVGDLQSALALTSIKTPQGAVSSPAANQPSSTSNGVSAASVELTSSPDGVARA